jgi:hypothetical protein
VTGGGSEAAGPGPSVLDRIARLPRALLLVVSGSLYLLLSFAEMVGESPTFDEGAHLGAGYTYVTQNDFRMNPEHPPLAKIWAGIALSPLSPELPGDAKLWDQAVQYHFGYRLLYQSGNSADQLLFWARIPTLFWGLLLVVSVYAVSHELFGTRGALISLVLVTFSPTLIGHGHLVTTDVIVTTLFFLTLVAFRRLLARPSLTGAIGCGILLGGSLGAKYSAILLAPILVWLALVNGLRRRQARGAREAGPGGSRRLPLVGLLRGSLVFLLIGFFSTATLWGLYGFRYQPTPDGSFEHPWNFDRGSLTIQVADWARDHRFLPEAYLNGYAFVHESTQGRKAFAFGQYSDVGWWWYFPVAFLVKTPFAALLLLGWGLIQFGRQSTRLAGAADFLTVSIIFYWVLAISSSINIGIRHILPIFPLMMVAAGCLAWPDWGGRGRSPREWAVGLLLAGSVLECLASAPYFLPYFNFPSCALFRRHEMLVDSNLDWGQDLARLKRYMEREGIPEVRLAYFGPASPRHLALRHEMLPAANLYPYHENEWRYAQEIRPGDVVAVSATSYVGVLSNDRDEYRRRLGTLKPFAIIGHSILLFRLPQGFQWTP